VNNDFRSRVVMPIVLPIVVLLAIAAFVGAIALTLLYSTYYGALMIAAVAAAGILFTVSLSAAQERLDAPRRGVVLFAAALPLLVGGGMAAGLFGDIADEDRMINVQPLITIPDDAPVIAAENSVEFCLLDAAGNCEATDRWEVVPGRIEAQLSFVFENLEAGVPHNVMITSLGGTPEDPSIGDEQFAASDIISGVSSDYHVEDGLTWQDLPDEWYFYCLIHPNMNGIGTVVDAT